MRARSAILTVTALLVALTAAAPAQAQDTEAPPGAGKNWLPDEDWVVRHWIPFEERRLCAALNVPRQFVFTWLDDYDHTLAGLARRQGWKPESLVHHLIKPWRGRVKRKQYLVLRSHTRRTMTQSHLSRHLLFHVFHNRGIGDNAQDFFGVSPYTWWDMRRSGHTVVEVARRGKHSAKAVRRSLLRFLAREQRMGVKRRMTSKRQARRLYLTQRRKLAEWMRENRLRVPEDHQH